MTKQINKSDFIAAFVLILFLISELFLKASVPSSFIKTAAVPLCILSWLFILYHFKRNPGLWDNFFTAVPSSRRIFVLAGAIIVVGFILRFWRLGTLFDGMAWDEAYKGLDALAIRKYGERPVFLNWNAGREALIAYLVAISQLFFDYSIISVRAVQAFFGGLALIVLFFLCWRLFNLRIALLATFLLAVSKWHIIFSRYGVRVQLIVFFEVIVLLFLARAIQSSKRNSISFVIAGFFGGLGLYTYIAYRIFPFIALVFLLNSPNLQRLKDSWKAISAGIIVALLVFAPLLNFSLKNRESFTDRLARTAVWNTKGTDLSHSELIIDSTIKTIGMFTYRGDAIDRHNVHEEPMLSPFACGFFLIGLGITLANIRKSYAAFMIIYLFLTILPGILSVNAPHSSRTIGSVIPAVLFTTLGISAAMQMLIRIFQPLGTLILAIVLGGNFYTGPNDGLLRYSQALDSLDPKTSALWGMDRDQYRVTQLINQLGSRIDPYLTPQLYFHSTVEYLTYSKSAHRPYGRGLKLEDPGKERKIDLIIVQPENCNLWWLRDDDLKNFYKWWAQTGPYDVKQIRGILYRSYTNSTTNTSDWRLIQSIRKDYPHARELKFDSFTVFLVSPSDHLKSRALIASSVKN